MTSLLRRQERSQFIFELLCVAGLTTPYDQNPPALCLEKPVHSFVARHIFGELGIPEFRACGWGRSMSALPMPMPETASHVHDCSMARQYDIRLADEGLNMQAKAVTHRVKQPSHNQFGLGILTSNRRHVAASFIGRMDVHSSVPYRFLAACLRASISSYCAIFLSSWSRLANWISHWRARSFMSQITPSAL